MLRQLVVLARRNAFSLITKLPHHRSLLHLHSDDLVQKVEEVKNVKLHYRNYSQLYKDFD